MCAFFAVSNLEDVCLIEKQCPVNAECSKGTCQCKINYENKGQQCLPSKKFISNLTFIVQSKINIIIY